MLHQSIPGSLYIASRFPSRDRLVGGLAKLLDASLIGLCLGASDIAWAGLWTGQYTVALLVAILAFTSVAGIAGLYRPWHGESVSQKCSHVWIAWAGTVFLLLAWAYLSNAGAGLSRLVVTLWLVATPLALCCWRLLVMRFFLRIVNRAAYQKKVVVWGRGETADQLVRVICQSPHLGLVLIDHITTSERDSDRRDGDAHATPPHAATTGGRDAIFEDLVQRAHRGDFNILYIARQGFSSKRLADFIDRLADTLVSVYLAPDFSTIDLFQGHWSSLEGIPLISVFDTPFFGVDGDLKRIEDIILSISILALVAVPMVLIAGLIKLTSRGPVIFRQRRYGLGGKPITVLKFRTMTVTEDGAIVTQAKPNDPRVTPLGAILRRTSLDELPQFFNVLRGEMSIVGPRPHAVAHNEFYRNHVKGYMLRHKVKPGITGWAQINGWRGETDDLYKMEQRVEYDFWYIRNWSMWLDIKIIALTTLRGFISNGAY